MRNKLLEAAENLKHLADIAGTPVEMEIHQRLLDLCERYDYVELMPCLMVLVKDSAEGGGGNGEGC